MRQLVALAFVILVYADQPIPPPDCPPYWKCTPKASWNDPNCKCWDKK